MNPPGGAGGADVALPQDTAATDAKSQDTALPDANTEDVGSSNTCEPGEGCFSEPCESADDCLSGICTMHLGDKVCSKTCDTTCPQGWSCTLVGTGSDGQYVCMSTFSHLCLPCEDAGTCSGDTPNACVKYPGGTSFCGGSCDLDTPCPSGYACQEVTSVNGATSFQCVNTAGVCPCSNLAIASTLSTTCETTNMSGTCSGVRICEESGLSACSAVDASAEVCNGIDDDCDGLTDNGTCDDGNPCTEDSCAGADGCQHIALDGDECLDGDVCTVTDHCEAGVCVGQPVNCDDGNDCTIDTCDGLGGCVHATASALCDDGDACTLGDTCKDSACVGSVTLDCDDGNACTTESCGATGCVYETNTEPCDDGNACSADDSCANKVCQGTPLTCDDNNPCTTDTCDAKQGCIHTPNTQPCTDGNLCTTKDVCADGVCLPGSPSICDDGNPCTDDSCDGDKGCVFTPNFAECDDGNTCTTKDSCVKGNCVGLGDITCDDGNACTTDSCESDDGCTHIFTAGPCDDGDICTLKDTCINGACAPGLTLECNDGNPCTDDTCAQDKGCTFTANQDACNDNNACTEGDVCQGGVCSFQETVQCDDGNICTDDTCDKEKGCVTVANSASCSDGNACTVDDTCSEGACGPGTKELACDDGQFCNGTETCDPDAGCVKGQPPVVDDGVACTTDICDEEGDAIVGIADDNNCGIPADALCVTALCDTKEGCKLETTPNCCGNNITEPGEDCDDGNLLDGDGCSPTCTQPLGSESHPAITCCEILIAGDSVGNGLYWLQPTPDAPKFQAHCDMERDDGGWTLIAVSAVDGQDTWTYTNRHFWDIDTKTFGSVEDLGKDFKSPAYHTTPFKDIMFVHTDSDVWASYHNVGNGKQDLGSFIFGLSQGEFICNSSDNAGYPLTAGTLQKVGNMCSDRLYFNSNDQDGSTDCFVDNAAYGPNWSVGNNNGCPMDDPGHSGSLGPDISNPDTEYESNVKGLGFAFGMGLGGGSMRVFVRLGQDE